MKQRIARTAATLEKVIAWVSRQLNSLGMAFLIFLMAIITLDVILRSAASQPIRGASEIAGFMMILLVFLAMAHTQYTKSNVAIDLLYNRFPGVVRRSLDVLTGILSLGIAAMMTWRAWEYMERLRTIRRVSDVLMFPLAPLELIVLIGVGLLSLVLLIDLIHYVKVLVKNE